MYRYYPTLVALIMKGIPMRVQLLSSLTLIAFLAIGAKCQDNAIAASRVESNLTNPSANNSTATNLTVEAPSTAVLVSSEQPIPLSNISIKGYTKDNMLSMIRKTIVDKTDKLKESSDSKHAFFKTFFFTSEDNWGDDARLGLYSNWVSFAEEKKSIEDCAKATYKARGYLTIIKSSDQEIRLNVRFTIQKEKCNGTCAGRGNVDDRFCGLKLKECEFFPTNTDPKGPFAKLSTCSCIIDALSDTCRVNESEMMSAFTEMISTKPVANAK